ncbi:MAG: hypothetical protein KA354_25070 [Phycisphaerae bacterium]|nr:hypothetical protein [Phycisphaerae bacterium]
MFRTNLWCYLWDLVDEGIGDVLDRLKGEAGATGISVAVNYHSADQLRPHGPVESRRFRSAGGAQFQPNAAHYASTRMRPVPADWLRKGNPLAAVGEACVKRGMSLRGWLVGTHGSVVVGRYPGCAVKGAFGQLSPNWLCPVNLDVREYLRGMIEDLTHNYPFETIELERATFPADLHTHFHDKMGVDFGLAGDWLRGLCLCESCRQGCSRDGLDAARIVALVEGYLGRVLIGDEPIGQGIEELVDAEPLLEDFAAWRCGQITSLIKLLKTSCRSRLVMHRSGDRFWSAADFAAIAPHCDALLPIFYDADLEVLNKLVQAAVEEGGSPERVELGLSACTPPCSGPDLLVAAVKRAVELGVRSVNIYNYGLIPLSRLEWIHQATRYARREAG